jgi:hypothetical protein
MSSIQGNSYESTESYRSPGATWEERGTPSIDLDASTAPEDASNIKLVTKDLKSMGLAAGGKLGTSLFSQLLAD